ncbi:BTAD domain-containing putative transcriptional regulator [Glycomyces endophyticus]|uniref:BTAD domain-containing putative transcriptional regulator n=1 Tax=Glycomyces endophyticus TaxID=480996 RepID=UPI0031D78FBA
MATEPVAPLGELRRRHRERAGLTQRELAERSGVSLAAVRDLEQGRSGRPRRASARRLASALGLSAEESRTAFGLEGPVSGHARPEAASQLVIGALGPLTVWHDGAVVPFAAEKPRSILMRLVLSAGETVGREALMDLVWGERRPATAVNLLYTYIARLRRLIRPGCAIEAAAGGYRLLAGPERLDLARFRELAAAGRNETDPERALGLFAAAAGLWRGETDVDALRHDPRMTAVTEEYADLLRDYAATARGLAECEQVLPRLRRLAHRLELHEPLHAELVMTLAAAGRQTEALSAYDRVRASLRDQLGIDPGERLRDAHRGVLRQDLPGVKPLRRNVIRQVPAAPPDFVGRERELAVVTEALGPGPDGTEPPARVVAVSGPAGVGKTALALQAARLLRDGFPDGQLYADLRGVAGDAIAPLEILGRFLRALGVPGRRVGADEAEAAALLRSELAGRRVLMVLDNARDAAQVAPLLPGTGECAVLVTGRRRFPELVGAVAVDVPVLPAADALDLLAATAGPQRILADPTAARRLAEACGLLPLALRIAGARLATRPAWSAADLVARLRHADRRLSELRAGELGVLASFRIGYRDLGAEAQRAFRWCVMHPGDEFGAAAAAVLLDVEPAAADRVLGELLDANMLLQFTADRFRYHDLLGLYASGLLAEEGPEERDAARSDLHAWLLHCATAAMEWVYPQLVRLAACDDREAVFDSAEAALAWLDEEAPALVALVEQCADTAERRCSWRLSDQLRGYFFIRRQVDRWLRCADAGLRAAVAGGDGAAQAAMHLNRGQALWAAGRHGDALDAYACGARLADAAGWREAAAYARHSTGLVLAEQGRLAEAEASFRAALELSAHDASGHVRAATLNGLGAMCADQGRLADAAEHFAAALEVNRAAGRDASVHANLTNLGMALRQIGREAAAEAHLREALEGYRSVGNLHGELSVLDELSQLHAGRGDAAAAVADAKQGCDLARAGGSGRTRAALLCTLGEAHLSGGEHAAALAAFQEALRLAEEYPFFAVRATVGLAGALHGSGGVAAARRHAARALEAARAQGFRLLEAAALERLGRCTGGGAARALLRSAADAYRASGAEAPAARVEDLLRDPAGRVPHAAPDGA